MKRVILLIIFLPVIFFYQCVPNGTNAWVLSTVQLVDLRCEYRVNPLGIDVLLPRLSWNIKSNERGQKQGSYQVLVASSEEKLAKNRGDLWNSGKIESDQSVHVVYGGLAEKIKSGFNNRFFDPKTNTYESETQCSYVLPLAFGLVPPENKDSVVANLVDDIMVRNNGHLSVGLIGMQWLMQVLSDIGHPEVAYTIATKTTRPGWGYMISPAHIIQNDVGPERVLKFIELCKKHGKY